MLRRPLDRARLLGCRSALALTVSAVLGINSAKAEQPPPPCHPNPTAAADEATVRSRGDVANLPGPLQDRLAQLANRPHTDLPLQAFADAERAGFELFADPLRLTPQDKLVAIVRKSQDLALAGAGGEENEVGGDDPAPGN